MRTSIGWRYLAVIIDRYSRRVVEWSVADHMRTELVMVTQHMAVFGRKPAASLVTYSERGSQYASKQHREALEQCGMV